MVATAGRSERRLQPGLVRDAVIATVVFALTVALLFGQRGEPDARSVDALGVLLAAISSLPLVARRRAPLAVFAITATASALLYALDYAHGPPLGPTVALFTLGMHPAATREERRLTLATVIGLFALHITAAGYGDGELPVVPALLGALVWGGAWVVGDRVRMRRERASELEQEADRELRLAVAEERTRIARDLHDSAGHAINVILVQAGAARLLSDKDPARAQVALSTIEDVARETVGEIDRLVHGLREDGTDGADEPIGLAALDGLVQRHRATGLDVEVATTGQPRPLATAVDQAAYRILQESLTNAGRHGGATARVEIVYAAEAIRLTVANPIPPTAPESMPGHGIVGMRERASLLGGRLDARRDGRTFRVVAELPYQGGER